MRRALFLFLVIGCETDPSPPRGFAQIPTEVKSPDQVIDLQVDTDRLTGVVCLRMDQLAVNRAALKQISGRAVAGLMTDISPRQAEAYTKTGKLPSSNKIEKREARKDMFDRMMDVAEITAASECFDSNIDECIKSGGEGQVCFDTVMDTCKRFDLKLTKSHCEMVNE